MTPAADPFFPQRRNQGELTGSQACDTWGWRMGFTLTSPPNGVILLPIC
jgi:hypothetical protein